MPPELSRRSFLKAVAVTGAAATGCGEAPGRQLMPYVIPDENVIPGVPAFYAGACRECAAGCGVVARVREGRVIKLEGNPRDPVSGGALCARGQAALQGLYNPDRLPGPRTRGGDGALVAVSWDDALATLGDRLRAAARAGPDRVAFLGPEQGPTLDDLIARWLGVWRSKRRVVHEALDDEPERSAAAICFRRTDLPVYRLDTADTILSFDADFLETWHSPVEFTRQYAAFRAPRTVDGTLTMGHAIYVGPRFGLTAANADEWLAPHPGTDSLVALGILALVARFWRRGVCVPGVAAARASTERSDPRALSSRLPAPVPRLRSARTARTCAVHRRRRWSGTLYDRGKDVVLTDAAAREQSCQTPSRHRRGGRAPSGPPPPPSAPGGPVPCPAGRSPAPRAAAPAARPPGAPRRAHTDACGRTSPRPAPGGDRDRSSPCRSADARSAPRLSNLGGSRPPNPRNQMVKNSNGRMIDHGPDRTART